MASVAAPSVTEQRVQIINLEGMTSIEVIVSRNGMFQQTLEDQKQISIVLTRFQVLELIKEAWRVIHAVKQEKMKSEEEYKQRSLMEPKKKAEHDFAALIIHKTLDELLKHVQDRVFPLFSRVIALKKAETEEEINDIYEKTCEEVDLKIQQLKAYESNAKPDEKLKRFLAQNALGRKDLQNIVKVAGQMYPSTVGQQLEENYQGFLDDSKRFTITSQFQNHWNRYKSENLNDISEEDLSRLFANIQMPADDVTAAQATGSHAVPPKPLIPAARLVERRAYITHSATMRNLVYGTAALKDKMVDRSHAALPGRYKRSALLPNLSTTSTSTSTSTSSISSISIGEPAAPTDSSQGRIADPRTSSSNVLPAATPARQIIVPETSPKRESAGDPRSVAPGTFPALPPASPAAPTLAPGHAGDLRTASPPHHRGPAAVSISAYLAALRVEAARGVTEANQVMEMAQQRLKEARRVPDGRLGVGGRVAVRNWGRFADVAAGVGKAWVWAMGDLGVLEERAVRAGVGEVILRGE